MDLGDSRAAASGTFDDANQHGSGNDENAVNGVGPTTHLSHTLMTRVMAERTHAKRTLSDFNGVICV